MEPKKIQIIKDPNEKPSENEPQKELIKDDESKKTRNRRRSRTPEKIII